MRRERNIILMAVLIATVGVVLASPGVAKAADPVLQGYGNPLVTVQPPTVCAEGTQKRDANGNLVFDSQGNAVCAERVAGVAGAQKSVAAPVAAVAPAGAAPAAAPNAGVKGATKVKQGTPAAPTAVAPAQRSAAPLATTKSARTLPFTGAELGVFAVVGLALLAGGLLLRLTARQKRSRA